MTLHEKLGERLPQRVLILRALQLGDLLCAVPAFRALRTALPDAHITLLGLPWAKAFVARFHAYLDEWMEFPGYPGLPEVPPQRHHIPNFLAEMQWLNLDLTLQMQGNGDIVNTMLALFGAQLNAGFCVPGRYYCPDERLFLPYPEDEPEVWRHLRLMEFLGIPLQGAHLEFPMDDRDWEEFEPLNVTHDLLGEEYICLHAGSRALSRRWPLENFAEVGNQIARLGYRLVLTGTEDESELADALIQHLRVPPINLVGKTSLGSLAVLLLNARLLFCNDTGISHMADALQVPSVVLFSDSDPVRWGPLDRERHCVIPHARNLHPQEVFERIRHMLRWENMYVPA